MAAYHFCTEQVLHCSACRRKWRLTDTDLCPCGETQMMSHIVKSCFLTKLNVGLSRLHSADEDAVSWLTSYGSWHAYEKKKNICVSGLLAAYICSEVNISDWQNGLTVSCIICDHWWHLKLVAFKWPVIILWWHRMAEPEHVRTLAECWVGQLNMCQLGQEVFVSLLLPAWLVWCAFVCNHCTGRASWTIVVYPPTGSTASVRDWAYTSSGVWPSFAFTVVYIMMVCRQG